ncbi:MAG: uracil-DNA glycosylase [Thermodesulfobacteriota bacterium]|nr:uracil-DNA glycosylase [Thermodesulfobacteriota bacterium]
MKNPTKLKKRIRCADCKHFYITWDEQFPYGCRAMGFKGKRSPATTVLNASEMPCQLFSPKPKPHGK